MEYKRGSLSNEELIHLYESILWPRMIEEKMLLLLRQGKISKWWAKQNYKVAHGEGLFKHNDWKKFGRQ
jgi:TPP-dependent pyruvate/acetoin dehydrogenase alpha subunit